MSTNVTDPTVATPLLQTARTLREATSVIARRVSSGWTGSLAGMMTNVPIPRRTTATRMPTAETPMADSHVLARRAMLAMARLAKVGVCLKMSLS